MESSTSYLELFFRGLAYLLLVGAGVWILIDPPREFTGAWGVTVTVAWGVSLIVSLGASIAAFMGKYRVEMIFIPFVFLGLGIYAVMAWTWIPYVTSRGPQALELTAFCLILVVRYINLMRLSRGAGTSTGPIDHVPQKPAGEVEG